MDLTGAEENLESLRKAMKDRYEIFPVSAATGEGLQELMRRAGSLLKELPALTDVFAGAEQVKLTRFRPEAPFVLEKENGAWVLTGPEVRKWVIRTNFANKTAVARFVRVLQKMGVERALRDQGAGHGDTVIVGDFEFEFLDE
jgi:GTP-binding protein